MIEDAAVISSQILLDVATDILQHRTRLVQDASVRAAAAKPARSLARGHVYHSTNWSRTRPARSLGWELAMTERDSRNALLKQSRTRPRSAALQLKTL